MTGGWFVSLFYPLGSPELTVSYYNHPHGIIRPVKSSRQSHLGMLGIPISASFLLKIYPPPKKIPWKSWNNFTKQLRSSPILSHYHHHYHHHYNPTVITIVYWWLAIILLLIPLFIPLESHIINTNINGITIIQNYMEVSWNGATSSHHLSL